ncbi:MAG: helix-turn-helix domain-containing protein [Anaerolineae bacterium]|nr:helix-turn-helix domain-containing protein [Anaerolineae bacterium]
MGISPYGAAQRYTAEDYQEETARMSGSDIAVEVLDDLSDECGTTLTFGETLDDLMSDRELTQNMLMFRLRSVGIDWSDNKISRIVNNDLPNNLTAAEVRKISEVMKCSRQDLARLILAFTCHRLRQWGVF